MKQQTERNKAYRDISVVRELVAHSEDLGLVPMMLKSTPSTYNSSSRVSDTCSWHPWTPGTHKMYVYTCRQADRCPKEENKEKILLKQV